MNNCPICKSAMTQYGDDFFCLKCGFKGDKEEVPVETVVSTKPEGTNED